MSIKHEKSLENAGFLEGLIDKLEFMRMPQKERWGVLVREDAPLARKQWIAPENLKQTPLLMVKREIVKNELAGWFGDSYESL